jgi:hypothetical protein
MKNLSIIFYSLIFVLIGCSATNTVTMSVQQPAEVSLPPNLKKAGVIDRSQTNRDGDILQRIDQVLSVKSSELEKKGVLAGINGLAEELSKNSRFEVVKILDSVEIDPTAYGVLPAPLSWEKISEICEEYDLDGLFSLEFFDTDTDINYQTNRAVIEGPLGIEIPALEHHATVHTTIKTGWRIYDNTRQSIIDEFQINETVTTTGNGINPVEAVNAVIGRTEAVQTVSGNIGRNYAQSILPYWTRVRRDYYVRGSDNFKVAKRRAQTGNWAGAADLWYAETQNPRAKIAGRAHYNMAIINEIEGNLDEAIEWVRIAYEDFGDKRALRYLRTLQNRQARMETLRRQQQEL